MRIRYFLATAVLAIVILGFGGVANVQAAKATSINDCLSVVGGSNYDTNQRISCIQGLIADLLKQIDTLQAQQNQGQGQAWCHTFNKNLRFGDEGNEVKALHTALTLEVGSADDSNYSNLGDTYSEYTASGIVEFQEKYASDILVPLKLKHGTGNFGPTTRKKMNELYGCGTTPKPKCTVDSDCPQPNCSNAATGATPNCIGSSFQCIEGKCTPQPKPTACTDSDGGDNPYVKGFLTINGQKYGEEFCYEQNSGYYGYVGESFCINETGTSTSNPRKCDNGCENGACKSPDNNRCGELIYFCADNSPYCNLTNPVIDQYIVSSGCVKVIKRTGPDFMTLLNQDALALKYSVNAVPTFMFVDQNGCFHDIGNGGGTKLEDIKNGIANFKCNTNSITITSPNGGETYNIGANSTILWKTTRLNEGVISINLSTYNLNTYPTSNIERYYIVQNSDNDGNFPWGVGKSIMGNVPAGAYVMNVCVKYSDGNSECDKSDSYFKIVDVDQPSITITSPNGGETYKKDGSIIVNWKTSGVSELQKFDIVRLRAYPNGREYNLIDGTLNDGTENIAIPSSVPAGAYTLEIKTYINNVLVFDASDSYFKIIDVNQPFITVLSPNGGEKLIQGETYGIRWDANIKSYNEYITIELWDYSASQSSPEKIVIANFYNDPNTTLYRWTVPSSATGLYHKIKIIGMSSGGVGENVSDLSDNYFSITSSTLSGSLNVSLDAGTPMLANLNAGQKDVTFVSIKLTNGSTTAINNMNGIQIGSPSANASDYLTNIRIYDGSTQIGDAVSSLVNNGSYYYEWIKVSGFSIPGNTSKILKIKADIRATAPNGPVNLGIAGLNFNQPGCATTGMPVYGNIMTIASSTQPFITVLSPNGGDKLIQGETYGIRWDTNAKPYNEYITIELWDYSASQSSPEKLVIANFYNDPNTTLYRWTVPSSATGLYHKIKIIGMPSGGAGENVSDLSDNYFSITPRTPACLNGAGPLLPGQTYCNQSSITVTSPNGGEVWRVGETHNITWTASNFGSMGVSINLLNPGATGAAYLKNIALNIPNSGSYQWTIPSDISEGTYNLMLASYGETAAQDYNNSTFNIVAPTTTESVSLSSVRIEGSNLKVKYSKNFDTCAHLLLDGSNRILHTQNWFCQKGNDIEVSAPLSDMPAVAVNQKVKLCNGNDYNMCSGLATITSTVTVTPVVFNADNQLSSISDALARIFQEIQKLMKK